jgi:hypothetical protein
LKARDSISDGKYVVFKVNDFYSFCQELWNSAFEDGTTTTPTIEYMALANQVLTDTTVIRDQDILSATVLDAYADAAMLAADVIGHLDGTINPTVSILQERAEFFRARAERARNADFHKIPD